MIKSRTFEEIRRNLWRVWLAGVVVLPAVTFVLAVQSVVAYRDRELVAVSAAIEAGPVAFLSLHAANIAQDQLDRMMRDLSKEGLALRGVTVRGGNHFEELFLKWSVQAQAHFPGFALSAPCGGDRVLVVRPDQALYPFQIRLEYDRCSSVREAARMWMPLTALVLLMAGIFMWLLHKVYQSLLLSGAQAQAVMALGKHKKADHPSQPSQIDQIEFIPMRDLARAAVRANEIQKLENAVQLAHQVAHDIRSPLIALQLLTEHLSGLPADLQLMTRSAIERIRQIASTLSSRKVEAGPGGNSSSPGLDTPTPAMNFQKTKLSALVDQIVNEKRLEWSMESGIKLELFVDPDAIAIYAQVDPVELSRVLSNLINNALEAAPVVSGYVRVRQSGFADEQSQQWAEITIEDNGPGIPQEVFSRLGERGFTHGKGGKGSGLGVWHAKQTIAAMAGTLEFQSRPDEATRTREFTGTIVRLRLPAASPPLEAVAIQGVSGAAAKGPDSRSPKRG